ncbi:nascent polypeptide-associated complex subunit alpha, muscle-specific form, partial [Pteropus vampyrus]|uniref:Nascent polypeptide-associated complex subunit alpha, muscle-specific form n=1 Tax=Pteropus vampyrus TaxID=132908 RepID=A0A6P6CY39_PTEVA
MCVWGRHTPHTLPLRGPALEQAPSPVTKPQLCPQRPRRKGGQTGPSPSCRWPGSTLGKTPPTRCWSRVCGRRSCVRNTRPRCCACARRRSRRRCTRSGRGWSISEGVWAARGTVLRWRLWRSSSSRPSATLSRSRGKSSTCGTATCAGTRKGHGSCSTIGTPFPCRGPWPAGSRSFRHGHCCLSLLTGQQDGTSPRAPSPADGHLQPPRPAWEEDTPSADGWPDAQGQLLESSSNMDQGDPQAKPSPSSAEGETLALTESQACSFQARSWHSGDGVDPCGPQEASVSSSTSRAGAAPGLGSANSLVRKPPEMESWRSGEQRTGTHWQDDTCALFPWQEATRQTARPAPAAAEEVVPHTPHQGSPLPQRSAPAALGSPSVSAPRTCSGSSAGSRAPSSMSSLSSPSLPEFQKVSAILVQLSESSVSLSDWEAGDSPDAELPGPRESSPRGACERPGGNRASPLSGLSAVSGGLESAVPGLMRTGWQPPLGDVPTSRSVSEVSSGIWDEEGLPEPSARAQPTLGRPSPAGGSSDLHSGRAPCPARPALGPGEGQEASGTSESLTSGSDVGKATRMSPEAACVASTSEISSSSDSNLSLSFPLASSTSEEAEFGEGGGTGPPVASAGRPRASSGADLGPPTNRKAPQASPVNLQAPPGDPSGLATLTAESQGPGCGGGRAAPVWEEAHPTLAGGVQPEILSPVDEVLSCGSADLPSCTHRATPPLPPAPTPPAESGATPSPSSEDFPSPPEDAMSPGGSLGPPEEDTSINTGQLPSLLHLGDELGLLPEPLPWKKARDASALTRTLADTHVLSGSSPELRLQVPQGPELHLPQYNQNVGKTVFLLAAIRVAALDCAEERNREVCSAYDIHFYPSFRYFKAFTKDFTTGENFKGPDRELQTVRRAMIDFLQNHTDRNRPPACPALDPIRPSDVL